MNLSAFLASLATALLAKLSSIGTAFGAALGTIAIGFVSDERSILLDVSTEFHSSVTAALAAGKSELEAIEEAATAAYNKFCSDETAEFTKEKSALIVLLSSSAKSAAGILKSAVTGG